VQLGRGVVEQLDETLYALVSVGRAESDEREFVFALTFLKRDARQEK